MSLSKCWASERSRRGRLESALARYPDHSASSGASVGGVHISSPSFISWTAFITSLRASLPGLGNVTLLIHILPLIPGSFRDAFCCLEIVCGRGESSNDRIILMISSVLRSHFVEVGDSQSECHTAVLRRSGIFGSTRRATAVGLRSIPG